MLGVLVTGATGTAALVSAASGFCGVCGVRHAIPRTPAAEAEALALQGAIESSGRFDFDSVDEPDARYRMSAMTSGKMLGVLICSDGTVLRAFSGMLGGSPGNLGTWHCPGWAGPVAQLTLEDTEASRRFAAIVHHVKAAEACQEPERSEHRKTHRALSLALSDDLASSVELRNARGGRVRLPELLARQREDALRPSASLEQQQQARAHPGGIGDCAAPKLLMAAFERGLQPESMAEIWHEAPLRRKAEESLRRAPSRGGRRKHGSFHLACNERCSPIMGFLLCGLETGESRSSSA